MRTGWYIAGIALFLFGIAFFFPANTLTGRVVQEGTCKGLGCSELCDADAAVNTCGQGETCCATHWSSGVCDYAVNCEKIREYSLYQSLETYQDSVREQPARVNADSGMFFIPLAVILVIIGYFAIKRNDPDLLQK